MAGKGLALGSRLSGVPRVAAVAAVIAVLVAMFVALRPDENRRYVTVDFPRTVSLYEGSEVKILGVPVGAVESVTPSGEVVQVRLWYDAEQEVPDDAKAVIISPSIVGDRYVQLTPAYTGGPQLPDGAHLDQAETAVPVELDEIYQSLDDLAVALGPRGANRDGALSDLIDVQAANLDGQGEDLRQTIRDLSLFTGTLSNNKEELFASLRQVDTFVHALRINDAAVSDFNDSLAQVSTVLAGERRDLARTLAALGTAMTDVRGFVQENEALLHENISGLARVTRVLVNQREALKEILDVAPVALSNLAFTYNGRTGTLDTRTNIGENIAQLESNPSLVICAILEQADTDCGPLRDIFDALPTLQRTTPFEKGRGSTSSSARSLSDLWGVSR